MLLQKFSIQHLTHVYLYSADTMTDTSYTETAASTGLVDKSKRKKEVRNLKHTDLNGGCPSKWQKGVGP